MRRVHGAAGALTGALAAVAIAVAVGVGSSHREAPLTSLDPTGDDTDVYAFTAKDAPARSRWWPTGSRSRIPRAARTSTGSTTARTTTSTSTTPGTACTTSVTCSSSRRTT